MEFAAGGFDPTQTGLVEDSNVAVWVGDVSLTLFVPAHCMGSNAHQCPDTQAWF